MASPLMRASGTGMSAATPERLRSAGDPRHTRSGQRLPIRPAWPCLPRAVAAGRRGAGPLSVARGPAGSVRRRQGSPCSLRSPAQGELTPAWTIVYRHGRDSLRRPGQHAPSDLPCNPSAICSRRRFRCRTRRRGACGEGILASLKAAGGVGLGRHWPPRSSDRRSPFRSVGAVETPRWALSASARSADGGRRAAARSSARSREVRSELQPDHTARPSSTAEVATALHRERRWPDLGVTARHRSVRRGIRHGGFPAHEGLQVRDGIPVRRQNSRGSSSSGLRRLTSPLKVSSACEPSRQIRYRTMFPGCAAGPLMTVSIN